MIREKTREFRNDFEKLETFQRPLLEENGLGNGRFSMFGRNLPKSNFR